MLGRRIRLPPHPTPPSAGALRATSVHPTSRSIIWKAPGEVENHGVPPDHEVEMNPKLVREGHDPQLEKAVVVLEQLKKSSVNYGKRPSSPNYQR